ncbi:MAG: InlB B-repeat-containing protein [Clostridiales bacterium]|nr:InlB B-repeat-containing protein [Clostridiales bacterium]
MKMTKRLLSLLLCLTMVTSIMTNLGAGLFSASAQTQLLNNESTQREVPEIGIVVPEVIYLLPGTATFGKYMGGGVVPGKNATTEGYITFQLKNNVTVDDGTEIDVTYEGADVNLVRNGTKTGSYYALKIMGGTAASSTEDSEIEWTFTYTVDGVDYVAKAYTYVYAPSLAQAGVQQGVKRKGDEIKIIWTWYTYPDYGVTSFAFLNGIHSVTGGNKESKFVEPSRKKTGSLRTSSPLYIQYTLNETWNGRSDYIPNGGDANQGGAADYGALSGGIGSNQNYFANKANGGVVTGYKESPGDSYTVTGGTGIITIDKSRHDNYNQIPYFTAGLMQFYYKQLLSLGMRSIASTDGAITASGEVWGDATKSDAYGYGLYELSGAIPDVAAGNSKQYTIRANQGYRGENDGTSTLNLDTILKVNFVDKQALRETVNTWVNKGLQLNDYSATQKAAYEGALLTAIRTLGNPRASQNEITAANNALKTAGNNLTSAGRKQCTYTVQHKLPGANGSVITVDGKNYTVENGYATVIETGKFFSGATLIFRPNEYTGYNPPPYPDNERIVTNRQKDITHVFTYTTATYTIQYDYDPEGLGHRPYLTSTNNPNSFSATFGKAYGTLASPTMTGWDFQGWYLHYDSATGQYTDKVTSSSVVSVNGEHTLYAKWKCGFGGGHGSEYDPFKIANADHLGAIDDTFYVPLYAEGMYFRQTADIDYNETFTLIDEFHGSYDGQNHTINVNGEIHGGTYGGFFGKLNSGAVVKNLYVNLNDTILVNSNGNVGFIGELRDSTVNNVHVVLNGTLNGGNVGGITGYAASSGQGSDASIVNCTVVSNNNIRLYGAKNANNLVLSNNWVMVRKLPADTTFDSGSNIMYIKSNDFIVNGTASVSTNNLGAIQFIATPSTGWGVEFRDGEGNLLPSTPNTSNGTYVFIPASNLTNARYYICFTKSIQIIGENTMGVTTPVGGTVSPTSASLEQGETLNLTAEPATGYNFVEWKIEGDSGRLTNPYSADGAVFTMGEHNVIIKGRFKPSEYTIKFEQNAAEGGAISDFPEDIAAIYNNTYTIPTTVPKRVGWTFVTWSTKDSGISGTSYAPGDSVSNLTTVDGSVFKLFAIWSHNAFDINFVANGAPNLEYNKLSQQIHGTTFTFPNTSWVGHTFYGWFDNPDFRGVGHDIGETETVTDAVTYYAKWLANHYLIAFDAKGGENAPDTLDVTYGVTFTIPTQTPTRTGYTFLGWDDREVGASVQYEAGQEITSNLSEGNYFGQPPTLIFYAVWEALPFRTVWRANGGVWTATAETEIFIDVIYDQPYSQFMPQNEPTKNGWAFAGWFTEQTGGTQIKSSDLVKVTGETVFYAHWQQQSYVLRFDKNAVDAVYVGEDPSGDMPDVTVNFAENYLMADCEYEREGYSFTGWSLTSTSEVQYEAGHPYMDMASRDGEIITLFAQWSPRLYNIIFNGNGNTSGSMAAQQVHFADIVNLNENQFVKAGFMFMGWATTQEDANRGVYQYVDQGVFIMQTKGIFLYAVWGANMYRIIFHGSGNTGGAMGGQLMAYGSTETLFKNAFIKEGYYFIGWSETENSSYKNYDDEASFTLNSESDKDLYAIWERNSYNLVFDGNADDAWNVPAPLTLYYDVDFTFVLTAGASQTVAFPSREGYDFAGWSDVPGVTAKYVANNPQPYVLRNLTNVNGGNFTLYAIWTPCKIAVTWDCMGGSINGQQYVTTLPTFGQNIVFPSSVPSKQGFVFDNWYDENDDQVMGDMVVDFADERTFFAHWIAAEYTVIYNKNSDDATGETLPTEHVCDVARTLATCGFVRPGYTFTKWNTMPDGSGADYYGNGIVKYKNLSYSNGAEVTLYAMWECQAVDFTVKFMGQNEERTDYTVELATQLLRKQTDSVEYASAYSNRAFSGYTWNNNDYYVKVGGDGDTILYVYYNRNTYTVTYHSNDSTDPDHPENEDTYIQYFFYGVPQALTPTSFRRSGFEFDHWTSRRDNGGTTYSGSQQDVLFSSDTDLYAQWVQTSSPYTVYHYVQELSGEFKESTKIVQELTGTSLSTITAQPMEIDGFVWDETVVGTVASGVIAVDGSLILKLYYVRQEYDIILDPNGGVGDEVTFKGIFGEYKRLPTSTSLGYSLPGYQFAGWTTHLGSTEVEFRDGATYQVGYGTQRLFAIWQTGLYRITFDSNGGSPVSDLVAAYGATISAPQPNPVKAGFIFRAWTLNGDDYEFTTMPRQNLELVADWTPDSVTVTFNASNATSGTVPAPITGQYGGFFEMPNADLLYDNATSEEYRRLIGWSPNENSTTGTLIGENTAFPASSVTLYPVWSANYYQMNVTIAKTQNSILPASVIKDLDYSEFGDYAELGNPYGWYPREYYTNYSLDALAEAVEAATVSYNLYFPQANQENVNALVDSINTAYNNIELKELSRDMDIVCPSTPEGHEYPNCYGYHSFNELVASAQDAINSGYYDSTSTSRLRSTVNRATRDFGDLGTKYPHYNEFVDIINNVAEQYHRLVLLKADFTEFEELYASVNRSTLYLYTDESVAAMDDYYAEKIQEKNVLTKPYQYIVDDYVRQLGEYIDHLEAKGANYTPVFLQFMRIPPGYTEADLANYNGWQTFNEVYLRSIYTAASVERLRLAVEDIDWSLSIADQTRVSGEAGSYEYNVRDAIDSLTLLSASYTVNHYVQNANDNEYTINEAAIIQSSDGAIVTATEKTIPGFHLNVDDSTVSGTVSSVNPLVLNLYYDRNNYTITFESNGGDAVAPMTARYGAAIAAPTAPNKLGATFEGWYTDADLENEFVFSTMPLNGATLYAKWEESVFTIDFMLNDGTQTVYRSVEFNEGFDTAAPTQAPVRAGYTFDGWYDNAECTGDPHVFGVMGNSNIAVYAKWIPRNDTPYSIVHNVETVSGDFAVHSQEDYTGTTGTTVTATPITLTGFELDETTSTLSTAIAGTGDTVLNLYYIRTTYTITFNTNGGSEIPQQFNKYGKVISAPSNPTKTGYVFGGWKLNGSVFIFSTMPAENITLDATWTPATNTPYTVKRYTQDTDLVGYTEYSSDILAGTTDAPVTANMGPIAGFTLDETKGTRSGVVAADGSLVLTLYYSRNSYTISFNSNGGSSVDSITQLYGTVVAAPENPQYPGYTFVKWQNAIGEDYTFTTMPAENIELTAVWATAENTPYNVEYYQENLDGTFTKVETATFSGKTNTLVNAEARTYTGFVLDETSSTTSGIVLPDGSLTLVMRYVRSQVTITFNTNGGNSVAPITAKYGAVVSAPSNPTKRGSIFNGWLDENGVAYAFTTMPASDITLYADWTLDPNTPYAVEYYWQDVGASTYTLHETLELSGEPGQPVSATVKAYDGFECDTYSSVLNGSIAGDGSLVLRVYYYRNYYSITFIVDEIGYEEQYSYEFGAEVTPAEDPDPPFGYVFSGWQNVPATMPAENLEIYGTFETITYKVTYLVDGEVFATRNYAPEIEIPVLEITPSKPGNDFSSWNGLPRYMPYYDITVTAVFTPRVYTLTYKAEGEVVTTQTYSYGDTVTAPAETPSKTGYTFVRWNDLPETMPSNDVTVTAAFSINTYNINYVVDGEPYGEPQQVVYGAVVTPIAELSRTGYTFSGWQGVPETMPANDVTVTGSFTAIDYTVTYYVDGVYYDEQTWHYDDTIEALAVPTKVGYQFSGWQNLPEKMPAEDVIATGVFTIRSYKVFYVVDGAAYGDQTYEYNTTIRPMAVPAEREGYVFSGWSSIPELMPDHDVTVIGEFIAKQFKVTFNVDGVKYDEKLVSFGSEITLPIDPSKTGYEFKGWKNLPATMPAEDIVLEADFAVKAYTITYKVDGEDYDTQTCNYGTTVVPIAEPSARVGYTFSGWQNVPETMPAENITVTGEFTARMYKVTFMDGDDVYAEIDSAFGAEPTVPQENPSRIGYTFRGWLGLPETMPANDITVTADYIVNSYRIYYFVDSELYETQYYNYSAEITPAVYPEAREGYTFSGWNNLPETMPASDLNIVGTFSPNIYRVTYYLDGEIYDTYTRIFGATLTQLPDPEAREGYTFSGWSNLPATMPAEDVDVSGSFLANTYQIFYFLDGEPYGASSYKYGDAVTAIDAPPAKTGYTFGGWQDVPETMPADNVNVYGVYNVNAYNINFYIDGEYDSSTPVNYGADVVIDYVPTKEGHEFNGWQDVPDVMPAEDVDVHGTFSPLSYKVTYISEGEYYGEEMFVYGTYVEPTIEEPTKTGYRFMNWLGIPEKMPAEDITLTAYFVINTYNVTYFIDGVQYGEPDEYEYQAPITLREEPEEITGYTFTGWSEIPETMPAYDLQVVGSYTHTLYTVTYYVDSVYFTVQSYYYGDQIVAPTEIPEKEGCTFGGWSEIPDMMPNENIEINGTFVPKEYNIIYKLDGEVYMTVPCTYTHHIEPIAAPPREGYQFDGWEGLPSAMPAHDVETTGSYSLATFKIIYYVDGAKYAEDEYLYTATVTPRPALPNKTGYVFSGWSEIPETMPSYNVEVFGEYILDSFTVTYMMDGEVYAEQTYASGETIVPPAAPTAPTGYVFGGWAGLPTVMPIKNLTVTGSFKKGTYKITYYVDGEQYAEDTYEYQQAVTPKPIPGTRTGYDFTGWTEIPETMPANNVSVYGNYVAKTYEINYYIDGVKVGTTYHAYGSTVSPLADQQRTGYTFDGWVGVPETMPANDVEVTGTFTINQYTITYVVDGEEYTVQTYDYDALITPPADPQKENSTFSGWVDLPAKMPADNIVINGSFERNKALVTFSLNGGTGTLPSSILDYVGTDVVLPAQGDITYGSREFLGWSTKQDGTADDVLTSFAIPASGATLYAIWSEAQIELVAKDGSGTYVDDTNGIIFGVEMNLSEADLRDRFIEVTGNGTIEIAASGRRMGTGTIITLCDAAGNELKSYYLVVFGDVDGDGRFTANDITAANDGLVNGFELDCYRVAANVFISPRNDRFNKDDVAELTRMFNEGLSQSEIADTLAYYSGLV